MKFNFCFVLATLLLAASSMTSAQRRRQTFRAVKASTGAKKPQDLNCAGRIDFELITGYVYSSADDIIDSKHRTLKVTECIDSCSKNPQCRAVNFETGLCILFKTAAGENSASLAVSQLPVFTLYAQKICLPVEVSVCSNPWAYETTPGFTLVEGFTRDERPVISRRECALECLKETTFVCRSASYNAESGLCMLAEINRNMANRRRSLKMEQTSDLIEVACIKQPQKLCQFLPIKGKILKTVDTVYQDVQNLTECKQRCLDAEFECHSYDFMSAGTMICRLSHHSSASLSHIKEPYIEVENTTTYELKGCYDIDVECRGSEMLAKIRTSSLFDGKVYVKNRPTTCVVNAQNATSIELSLPYNDIKCDVIQEGAGIFSSNIVIQHHSMIVTSADVGLALECKYDLQNTTVTNSLLSGLEVKDDSPADYIRTQIVSSPNVTMRITTFLGEDVISAQVGDELALRFEILDKDSPYEIFVRELYALDGQDTSEIMLIDTDGCPTDSSILQAVRQVTSGKILQSPFHAFKFPASEVVQFRATVTPCFPKCEPVTCNTNLGIEGLLRTSYGRKKRSINDPSVYVAKSLHITDKFHFHESMLQEEVQKELAEFDINCLSYTAIVICGILFLLSQVVVLMVWNYLWHKKRATKQIHPATTTIPPQMLYDTMSSKRTSTSYLSQLE